MPRGNQPPVRNALLGVSDEETVSRVGNIPLFKRGSVLVLGRDCHCLMAVFSKEG